MYVKGGFRESTSKCNIVGYGHVALLNDQIHPFLVIRTLVKKSFTNKIRTFSQILKHHIFKPI